MSRIALPYSSAGVDKSAEFLEQNGIGLLLILAVKLKLCDPIVRRTTVGHELLDR